MNIPNILTLARFLLIPVFVYYFFLGIEGSYIISAIVIIVAGITDVLDGYIARKFNMITQSGKLLDPLADKLMQMTILFCLTYQNLIPLWATVIILVKEVLMVAGSIMLYQDEIVVGANQYGKLATFLFYGAIISIIVVDNMSALTRSSLMSIVVAGTLFAFVRYSWDFRSIRSGKGVMADPEDSK